MNHPTKIVTTIGSMEKEDERLAQGKAMPPLSAAGERQIRGL